MVESEYDATTKTLTVTPQNALSLDGAYEVTIKYGLGLEETVEPIVFGYEVLFEDDFSDVSYTKANWHLRNESLLNGENLIDIDPYYAKILRTTDENALWKDYTVEFDYLGSTYTDETVYISSLRTAFYVSSSDSALGIGGSNENIGVSIPAVKHNWDKGELCYSTGTASMVTDSGIMPATNTVSESVTLSTSMFGNTAYSLLTKADGTLIYAGHSEVPSLSPSEGKFGILAWTNPEKNAILDNVVAYKLKLYSGIEYAENQTITSYGSKGNLVFKFGEDVIKAKAELTQGGVNVPATSSYSANTLIVKPEADLDINGIYDITISYGINYECSQTKKFGYEVLMNEDFSKLASAKENFYYGNRAGYEGKLAWTVNEDGQLVKLMDDSSILTYGIAGKANGDTETWKDYTVEFDFIGKADLGIYNGEATTAQHQNLSLGVFFYTSELNLDDRFLMRVDDYESSVAMYSKTVLHRPGINENKSFTYSASMFGDDVYSKITNITDNEVVLQESKVSAVYKNVAGESDNVTYNCVKAGTNEKTSGGFAISGSYGWNDGAENTFDNVLCYKLYEIESTTQDIRYSDVTVENGAVTVSGISYYNTTATPILAVYGENNKLLGVSYTSGQPETLTVENVTASDIVKVRLMLWEDTATMKSVRNALIVK